MTKPEPSALVAAASAFDHELATYARLGELFLRTPLETLKQVERANSTLGELAACEQRLQQAGQQMIEALAGARRVQEQLAEQVVEHAPKVQARNQQINDLMTALGAIAGEVGALNSTVAPAGEADASAVAETIMALSTRAEQLAGQARSAELAEIAEQAHALHQRLLMIAKKLQRAAGN